MTYIGRRNILKSTIVLLMLLSTTTIIPVHHAENNPVLNIKKSDESLDLQEFIFKIDDYRNNLPKKEIYSKINNLLDNSNNHKISENIFIKFDEFLSNTYGKEESNLFFSILLFVLEHSKESKIKNYQLLHTIRNIENMIFDELSDLLNPSTIKNVNSLKDKSNQLTRLIDDVDTQTSDPNYFNGTGHYWENFVKAKKIWSGEYWPSQNAELREKPKIIFDYWSGNDFQEWFLEGCDFLYGIATQKGQAKFLMYNKVGWIATLIALIISSGTYFIGMANEDFREMAFALGGAAGIIGLFISVLQLLFDWQIIYYFLYGINYFLNLFEWGNVNFIVEVKGEKETINNYKVKAQSLSAKVKYEETEGGHLDENVNFSLQEEFTYNLRLIPDESLNDNCNVYSICYPEYIPQDNDPNNITIHEQWQAAVPPPEDWIIRLYDSNGDPIDEKIKQNVQPRTINNVEFDLTN